MPEEQVAEEAAVEAPVEMSPEVAEVVSEETAEAPVVSDGEFNSFDAFSKLRESLADEGLRKQAERFQSFEDIVKGNAEQRKQLSKAIVPPGPDAKPSELAAFRKALGVPETIEDYEIPIPEGIDEEVFQTEAMQEELKFFAELAHQNNIPSNAFKELLNGVFTQVSLREQMQADADNKFAEEAEASLKNEWGAQYNSELEFSNRGVDFAFSDAIEEIKSLKVGEDRLLADHPLFIKAMNKIGRAVSEDSVMSFPVDAQAEQGLRQQLEQLTADQADAQLKGEYQKAQSIDLQIMEVARKLSGDNPIVGAGPMR